MPIKQIYFWNFGFRPNVHVYKTNLFLEIWVYTKVACPENKLLFGIIVLYQICMSRKQSHFGNVGCIPNLHVHNTN